jgi:hypothetical protein
MEQVLVKNSSFNTYLNWKAKETDKLLSQTDLLWLIKEGNENAEKIKTLRKYKKGDDQYEKLKEMLPIVAWNANFDNGKKGTDFKSMSGCLYFDKDALTEEEIVGCKDHLMTFPYVIAVWESLGGRGIGCLIKADIAKEDFSWAWEQINSEIGISFDAGAKKLTQVNVISYDPDIRINEGAVAYQFIVPPPDDKKVHSTPNLKTKYIYDQSAPFYSKDDGVFTFHTKLDDSVFGDKQYAVFEDKIDFLKIYTPFNKIQEGKRHNTLSAICCRMLKLNPKVSKDHLLQKFDYLNKVGCTIPLPYPELKGIFESCYKKLQTGELYAKPDKRFLVFKDNSGLSTQAKRKIIGTETSKSRRGKTEKKLRTILFNLQLKNEPITQKTVADLAKVSIRTVKNYWKAITIDSQEIWVPIPDYSMYEISKTGALRKFCENKQYKILKQRIDRAGYMTVRLYKNSKSSTQLVHRLLALTYIPNEQSKRCVNHINGNKLDNSLSNLEWSTHAENIQHAYNTGLVVKMGRPIIDNCTGQIFKSLKEASTFNLIPYSTFKNYLNGKRKNPTCLQYWDALEVAS